MLGCDMVMMMIVMMFCHRNIWYIDSEDLIVRSRLDLGRLDSVRCLSGGPWFQIQKFVTIKRQKSDDQIRSDHGHAGH